MYVYRVNFVFNVTLMCCMTFYLSRVGTTTFIFINVYYFYFNLSELNAFCCLVLGYGHILSIMGLSSSCIVSAILIFMKLMQSKFTSGNFFSFIISSWNIHHKILQTTNALWLYINMCVWYRPLLTVNVKICKCCLYVFRANHKSETFSRTWK